MYNVQYQKYILLYLCSISFKQKTLSTQVMSLLLHVQVKLHQLNFVFALPILVATLMFIAQYQTFKCNYLRKYLMDLFCQKPKVICSYNTNKMEKTGKQPKHTFSHCVFVYFFCILHKCKKQLNYQNKNRIEQSTTLSIQLHIMNIILKFQANYRYVLRRNPKGFIVNSYDQFL